MTLLTHRATLAFLIGVVVLFSFQSCALRQYTLQGDANQAIVLASAKSKCRPEYEKRIWMALFGAVSINSLNKKEYFKNPKASYRITESMEWSDFMITIFGGWLVSVTTRTWLIESCESDFRAVSKEEDRQQSDSALQNYIKSKNPTLRVQTSKDKKWVGKLLEISADYWILEVQEAGNQSGVKKRDILELKNGKIITGNVLNQSVNSVRFRSAVGTRRYLKSTIRRLKFQSEEKVSKKVAIKKDTIVKILFE